MKERIAKIIIDELKLKDVTPATFDPELDLIEDLGIDSMELTTIVVVLQDEFGVSIDEDDFSQLTTLSKITTSLPPAAVKPRLLPSPQPLPTPSLLQPASESALCPYDPSC